MFPGLPTVTVEMNRNGWYRKSFRRSLVDMHIADWDESFLSEFSPEKYVEYLIRARIQTAMIYAQAHTGLAYFPSKAGPVHSAFNGERSNLMKQTVDLCHDAGISVVSYYSLIYNTWAEEAHPDWRMQITRDGESLHQRGNYRYGLCCPNNPEYRKFVVAQLSELLDYITPEGIFFDMTFWPYMCQCPYCRARWKNESGTEQFPKEDFSDVGWRRYIAARERWMGEFAHTVSNAAKRLRPGITTEHNYASGVSPDWKRCVNESVSTAGDYCGGDLYGDLYAHSFAAKYYQGVSLNQPFEYMTSRCDADLYQHTVTKSEERLTAEVLLTAVHHGASLIIDAIEPDGTLDMRTADKIGRVYDRQIPYEKYFIGKPVYDAAVLYSVSGKYDPDGIGVNHAETSVKAVRRLIEDHIPVGVLSANDTDKLRQYRCIIASQISGIGEQTINALIGYVQGGGCLYLSGACERKLVERLFEGTVTGFTASPIVYFSPSENAAVKFGEFTEKYPLQVNHRVPLISGSGENGVLARINIPSVYPGISPFVSIHTCPPGDLTGYPAVIYRKIGEGKILWSASPIENDDRPAVRKVFSEFMGLLLPADERTVLAELPKTVEVNMFRTGNCYNVSLFDYISADDERIVPPAGISISTPVSPYSVKRLPEGNDIPFTFDPERKRAEFAFEPFSMFDMYGVFFGIENF